MFRLQLGDFSGRRKRYPHSMSDGKSRYAPLRAIWRGTAVVCAVSALAVLAVGLSACQPRIDTRGNLPDPELVQELRPGIQTREQVARLLGTPSTIGTFDDKKWYYISKRTETVAFFDPNVVDQQVLVLKFDDAGVLADVKHFDRADGREVQPVGRTTPTAGKELTVLKQLFGNLGRFNRVEDQGR